MEKSKNYALGLLIACVALVGNAAVSSLRKVRRRSPPQVRAEVGFGLAVTLRVPFTASDGIGA